MMQLGQEGYRTFVRSLGFIGLGAAFVVAALAGQKEAMAALGTAFGMSLQWYYSRENK